MRRRFLFIIVFMLPVITDSEPPVMSSAVLTKSFWGTEKDEFGYALTFSPNGTVTERFMGEGCGGVSGRYQIQGSSVTINLVPSPGCDPGVGRRTCVLEETPESLYRTLKLRCEGGESFWRADSVSPAGKSVHLTVPAITMGKLTATTTTEVKFRAAPDVKAGEFQCAGGTLEKPVKLPYLDKDHQLTVLARTENQVKVQNWTNYWYYVRPSVDWYLGGCDAEEGWVFGEFVKIAK